MDLSSIITGIHFRSNATPDIDLTGDDLWGTGTTAPNPAMLALQPQISLDVAGGGDPVVIAPYGTPGPTQWTAVAFGLSAGSLILLGFATYGAYRYIRGT